LDLITKHLQREERQELEELSTRLRIFSGYDVVFPQPQEEEWIDDYERQTAPFKFRLKIPNLPARKESVTTHEGVSSDIDISAKETW
jgi:hypothetical protein